MVLGPGSIYIEMLRYLAERLPAMVCPRWVRTRIQPIALSYRPADLVQAPGVAPGVYEIGGAESTTYPELISDYARVRCLRKRLIFDIPWLMPHQSSYCIDLITPVDRTIGHRLIERLATEVVVVDPEPDRRAFTMVPMGIARALSTALDGQDGLVTRSMFYRVLQTARSTRRGVHRLGQGRRTTRRRWCGRTGRGVGR
ncbi:MAG: Rossmann-fold NAD(P)-binding domain-containing protein [Acidimicrobiales bacterium]